MKTLDEWLPSGKGDGRKFERRGTDTIWFEPYFRVVDTWYGVTNRGYMMELRGSLIVDEWHPPKKTKKVTMCRPIRKATDGGYYISATWMDNKGLFIDAHTIVGWQEMEVEVDE